MEYSPYLSLACHALSLGVRLGEIGCELTNHKDAAILFGLVAVSVGQVGIFLSAVDAGMMTMLHVTGFNNFFGDLASWTRKERLTAYMLTAVNIYLTFKDTLPQ